MLEHGGRLRRAARAQGSDPADWLDLSTGVSPFGWPVPSLPAEAWRRLPEDDDGLVEVARACYGAPRLLPVAGSQAAIQTLPRLRASSRVGVIAPGYAEHAAAWARAGHAVQRLPADTLLQQADQLDVMVLIHPNNPGGETFDGQRLLDVHARLAARGGWLLVDEAFMDATPAASLMSHTSREGLIVLRSVGKFFGLAGIRAGFVAAAPALLHALAEELGPWTVNGPARHVLRQALADHDWQVDARRCLEAASRELAMLLTRHGLPPTGSTAFFHWCVDELAEALAAALARRAILVRRFDAPASLRFGLPPDAAALARLDRALAEAVAEVAA